METYILDNKKGGVGKSSSTINLATMLAALGFQVGLVDGDDQANATSVALPRRHFPMTLTDVVTRRDEEVGRKTLHTAMVQVRKRLWVVPADTDLGSAQVHIRRANDFDILTDRVDELRRTLASAPPRNRLPWWNQPTVNINAFQVEATSDEEYMEHPAYLDFLFFDSPPHDDDLTVSMLFASDKVIIPTELEEFSFQGLAQLIHRVKQRFLHRNTMIDFAGILPNKMLHRPNHTIPLDYLESLFKHFPELSLRPVHFDPTLSEAQGYHTTALELKNDARAVREYCALALELVGYEGTFSGLPICDLCASAVKRAYETEESVG